MKWLFDAHIFTCMFTDKKYIYIYHKNNKKLGSLLGDVHHLKMDNMSEGTDCSKTAPFPTRQKYELTLLEILIAKGTFHDD